MSSLVDCDWIQPGKLPLSTISLLRAIELCQKNPGSILLTLPTSKDQLIHNNLKAAGYTQFFRHYFKLEEASMVFYGPVGSTVLMSDHIPLRDVASTITPELIEKKISLTLKAYPQSLGRIKQVLCSGINPHAGENGILGDEDASVEKAIKQLQKKFPHISFLGPLSGDTLYSHNLKDTLLIYMFHDQALGAFKALNGFLGVNITLGLPFLRLSVDHGTAFDLYGKGEAQYSGCLFTLQTAITLLTGSPL